MARYFHGRVFCSFLAWQLFPMGALSPRRRRVVQICRQFIVCWPQRSSTGSFCGLRYNPIRIQRLFLPTFSGKTEKVGPRSDGCDVAAFNSSPVQTGMQKSRRSGRNGGILLRFSTAPRRRCHAPAHLCRRAPASAAARRPPALRQSRFHKRPACTPRRCASLPRASARRCMR